MTKKILTDEQIVALQRIGATPSLAQRFYLTGGTALAGLYLHHRYSEDLDFFSVDEVDPVAIRVFWEDAKGVLKIKKIDTQQSYNRNLFFLHTPNGVLKTEFTYFPFPRIELGKPYEGVAVDSILDIAVNKLFTIYQRTAARDYIDLYCLCKAKKYTVADLLSKAKTKFDWHIDPIQLGTQFSKAQEATDMPKMIARVAPSVWRNFFLREAKNLGVKILQG